MTAQTWAVLLMAMSIVESGNDPNAINERENAHGPLQVRAAALQDVNEYTGQALTLQDCHKPTVARWVVVQYARRYKATTPEDVARLWNGGPDRGPRQRTGVYWAKVRAEMDRIERDTKGQGHDQPGNCKIASGVDRL